MLMLMIRGDLAGSCSLPAVLLPTFGLHLPTVALAASHLRSGGPLSCLFFITGLTVQRALHGEW
jgi:hypothetical protein